MRDLTASYSKIAGSATVPTGALAGLYAWIGRLPSQKLHQAVPELIVQLDRLLASPLDLETRYPMARALKGVVLHIAAALPKTGAASGGLSLEQRLYDAMARNCKRLLQDLDRQRFGPVDDQPRRRQWALRNSFRFLGRQILHALGCGRPWPKGVWQDLHDLYVYVVVRGNDTEPRSAVGVRGFDPERAYKRLLLVGLVADLVDRQGISGAVMARLAAIADECALLEPDALIGEHGLTLVEVSCDRPPRLKPERLQDPFRGWVLRAPAELEVLLLNLDPFQQRIEAVAA